VERVKIEGGESEGTGRVDRVREGRLKQEVRERKGKTNKW
jgi:hypothetical protein